MLVGLTAGLLVGTFGWLGGVDSRGDFWDGASVGALVATVLVLVGTITGFIGAVMSQVANDPPPPQVPESTIIAVLEAYGPSVAKLVEGSNKNGDE